MLSIAGHQHQINLPQYCHQTLITYRRVSHMLTDPLGNGLSYPRDIGRSSSLGDAHVLFNFGDTFAHDVTGKCIGSTSSTLAVAMNTERLPTVTAFRPDENGVVPSFIPFLETEKNQYGKRTTFRCFGGILELDSIDSIGDISAGWIFYQKGTHVSTRSPQQPLEHRQLLYVQARATSMTLGLQSP
jgi:hypothetical protein